MKIIILGVCEVRWTQSGKLTPEGTTFIYSGGTEHKCCDLKGSQRKTQLMATSLFHLKRLQLTKKCNNVC